MNIKGSGEGEKHDIKTLINLLIICPDLGDFYYEVLLPSPDLTSIILFYYSKFQQNTFVRFPQNKTHFTVNLQVKHFCQLLSGN